MSYTAATTTELAKLKRAISFTLELRTKFGGSSSWQAYDFIDFQNDENMGSPASLAVVLPNSTTFAYSDESDQTNRMQLATEFRLTCTVGSESEVLIQGIVKELVAEDYGFTLRGLDWQDMANWCNCEVHLEPSAVTVVDSSSYRQLYLVDGTDDGSILGHVYGLAVDGSGTDPGFDEASQEKRRSWKPGNIRIYRTATPSAADDEVSQEHFEIDYTSGAVTILEKDTASYFINDLEAYQESAATAATDVDFHRVAELAWAYAKADGGMGLTSGVDFDVADVGLDLAGAFNFIGKVTDLFAALAKSSQANLVYYYDSRDQKHKYAIVEQKAAGAEDFTALNAVKIAQPRVDRDFYTRVVATGKSELPANILAYDGAKVNDSDANAVAVTDLRAELGLTGHHFFEWVKANGAGGASGAFNDVKVYLYDGDHGHGTGAAGLPSTENGGSDQYDSWYAFAKIDRGITRTSQRIRVKMGSSANANQNIRGTDAHPDYFWPGIWVRISDDDTNYYDIGPTLYKRREAPSTLIDIPSNELTHPRGRYLRIYLGAYKQGISNAADPAIGLLEFEDFCDEDYRVVKEISSNEWAIILADQVHGTFTIDGDYTATFVDNFPFAIKGSTGNDGFYRCNGNSTLVSGDTVITVDQAIADGTADGNIGEVYLYTNHTDDSPSYWYRSYPDLYTRYGRFRTKDLPLENRYNEYLAHDVALMALEESVRLFQAVDYECSCDPRVQRFDTLNGTDELNGDVSFFVDRISRSPNGTVISGVNYLAEALGE